MVARLYRILTLYVSAMLVVVMQSCSGSDSYVEETGADTDADRAMVSFVIVTPKSPSTRAATPPTPDPDDKDQWSEDYVSEVGDELDNRLIVDQLKVVVTDNTSASVLTTVRNLFCVETSSTATETVYNFLGIIPKDDVAALRSATNAKVHVIANAGTDATITGNPVFNKSGVVTDAIPMWGVNTVPNFASLIVGGVFDVGTVYLLRAMAKVEISILEMDGNVVTAINGATVNNANSRGYVLPLDYSSVSKTRQIPFERTMNALESRLGKLDVAANDNKITFYLPETPNGAGDVNITLAYKYDDYSGNSDSPINKNTTATLHFAGYDESGAAQNKYNIVRNHLYQFRVMRTIDKDLQLLYTVCPWSEYIIDIPTFD